MFCNLSSEYIPIIVIKITATHTELFTNTEHGMLCEASKSVILLFKFFNSGSQA